MEGKKSTVSQYLRGIVPSIRRQIRNEYRRRLAGACFTGMNNERREMLQDAIFALENERESTDDGRPYDKHVVAMRTARNLVLDDMRWNEPAERPIKPASMTE